MKLIIGFVLLFMIGTTQAASLNSIRWQGDPFVMISRGTPLNAVITDFGTNYGIPVVISSKVTDEYSGRIQNKKPLDVISDLSRKYGLVWYYNNGVLYVYKTSELMSEVLPLDNITPEEVSRYLRNAGALDEHACNVKPETGISSVQLVGVPICVMSVTKLTEKLDSNAKQAAENHEIVKVYQLNYASASDSDYSYRKQPVTVPGLVSVLREMGKELQKSDTATGPVFAADPRQNAIIVRGSSKDQDTFAALIRQLDIKPTMIEVAVSIFDIDASNFNQLGIDWSASAKIGGGAVSFNSGSVGDNFSTVIGNTGNFMVRLNALEQNSKAKVLSRPSVVTLNNVQAVLDKNITFYTKVRGEKVAKLESVTTGSLLRVTPRIITDHGQQEVMLVLNIQDGQQSGAVEGTDGLPQVQNSEISTQATLKSGESLLIGGFVQDKDETSENKIPLLGDLPILGGLFRSTEHHTQRAMRLFLIKAEPINQ